MTTQATFEAYKDQRKVSWYWNNTKPFYTSAAQALRTVKYDRETLELKARFEKAGGYECYEPEACNEPVEIEPGRLRLVQCPDQYMSFDDLAGDTYNADVNPDVPKHVMDKERKAFENKIDQEGVYGYRAEVWDGDDWVETDSCWGFVGEDFHGSGYEGDFYRGAIDALDGYMLQEALDFEETRPDMYQMKPTTPPARSQAWNRRQYAASAFASIMLGVMP